MNDKKHDELEALLIERAENLNDPEAYHGDIAEVMLKAADAIAELREKNAGLVEALERAARVIDDNLWTQREKVVDAITILSQAAKENTQ